MSLLLLLVMIGVFVAVANGARRRQALRYGRPGYGQLQYAPPAQPQPRAISPADVESLRSRLAGDVSTLQAGDDPVLRQAMADASERLSTCSSLLERAQSQEQLRTAWVAATEGLHATRLVRTQLGLDPGPAPALPPGSGPQLQGPTQVVVDGRPYTAVPQYEPGYSNWFPGGSYGGTYLPGGWYRERFWPGSLVLGALSGWALGSLLSGPYYGYGWGYGPGYDGGWFDGGYGGYGGDAPGWDGGYGGGDDGFGGFGGGGDFAGDGGGDWGGGGDFGGGDFGGGDFGGGDFGGGDFGGGGDSGGW